MLPLLLIPSWALAIDPFLPIGAGPGPKKGVPAGAGLAPRAQEGINSRGNILDMKYYI